MKQADPPRQTLPSPGPVSRRGGDESSDGTLHVGGAAAIKGALLHLAAKRIDGPKGRLADRHHVGVPGEAEMRSALADAGIEIVDRRRARLGEAETVAGETEPRQRPLDQSKRAALGRRHARAAHEIAGQSDRVEVGRLGMGLGMG